MGEKRALSDFEHGLVAGIRQAAVSFSETEKLTGSSQIFIGSYL